MESGECVEGESVWRGGGEGGVCGGGEEGMSETLCSGTSGPHQHTIPVFSTTVAVEHAMFTVMRGFTVYHNQAVWYSNHGH